MSKRLVDIDEHHREDELFHEHLQERQEDSPDDETHAKFASGPKAVDPYEGQDGSNLYIPIIATVILVIPIVVCLVKMWFLENIGLIISITFSDLDGFRFSRSKIAFHL